MTKHAHTKKLRNVSKQAQSFHVAGHGFTIAPGESLDVVDHVAADLATSFPDRFAVEEANHPKKSKES